MSKTAVLAVLLISLQGCSWIESAAGKSRYRYTYEAPDGSKHTIDLLNAKNVGEVMAEIEYQGAKVTLYEKGVDASGPMATMAEANGKLVDRLLDTVPIP